MATKTMTMPAKTVAFQQKTLTMPAKNATMPAPMVGPASWRQNTLNEIKMSKNIMRQNDRSIEAGKSLDPLPNLRDTVADLSNEEAHRYFRQTRQVVCLLRESLLDTNEEIKALTRGKEALEKALDHTRKDIALNIKSQGIRTSRPVREKEQDGADSLLSAEKQQLQNMKKTLESQLLLVQQQLQTLDAARKRLSNVLRERSRVLDLICATVPAGSASSVRTSAKFTRSHTMPEMSTGRGSSASNGVDPLGPFTPEVENALLEAKEAQSRSNMLRKEVGKMLDKVDKVQKATHRSVNDGLINKVAETVSLKQRLEQAKTDNRHSLQKAKRWYDSTEMAWYNSRGPLSYSDLQAREKLNRPIISMYQRHPGTNLPEAQEIVRGGDGLIQSLQQTGKNIGMLRLAELRLKDDIRDKTAALNTDSDVLRLRRRRGDHRWVMGATY